MNLKEEILIINKHIQETPISGMYPDLSAEVEYCSSQLSRSGEILAEAQTLEKLAKAKFMKDMIEKDPKIGATMLKELVSALIANESEVVTLADRLCASLTHRMDVIRTQISYLKSDLERSRFSGR